MRSVRHFYFRVIYFMLVACNESTEGGGKPGLVHSGISCTQGPELEGVKWELGFCLFFGWENGISYTGTGIHQQKNSRR